MPTEVVPMNTRERLQSVNRAQGYALQAHEHIARTTPGPHVTIKEECLTLAVQLRDKLASWAEAERERLQ